MTSGLPWWLIDSGLRTDWMEHAMCRQIGHELFFPEGGENVSKTARAVCGACPVQDDCLNYALAHPGIHGMWGGTIERERARMRRMNRCSTGS